MFLSVLQLLHGHCSVFLIFPSLSWMHSKYWAAFWFAPLLRHLNSGSFSSSFLSLHHAEMWLFIALLLERAVLWCIVPSSLGSEFNLLGLPRKPFELESVGFHAFDKSSHSLSSYTPPSPPPAQFPNRILWKKVSLQPRCEKQWCHPLRAFATLLGLS